MHAQPPRAHGRIRRAPSLCFLTLLLILPRCAANAPDGQQGSTNEPTLTVVLRSWVMPGQYETIRATLARFTTETGIRVNYVPALRWKPQRLNQYLEWLNRGTPTPDVYEADVTDVWSLADHMIDLAPHVGDAPDSHFPAVMKNYVVHGKLMALPLYTDIELLFHRTDLLRKYGYTHPPRTWDELEQMARTIQAGERAAGQTDFWGLSWTGSDSDDLLCVALACQMSYGGGAIIDSDATISVNNPRTVAAFSMLRRYVGTVSPPGVTAYGLEDARGLWDAGKAAFLIYWPFAYTASQAPDSVVRNKVGVTLPPSGGAGQFGTLGGWQLSVSKYSRHPREAAQLVLFLTSRREQLHRALTRSDMPTFPDLYDEPSLIEAQPHFAGVKEMLLRNAVARPSTVAGRSYPQVAAAYSKAVHAVLTDRASAADAVADLERQLMAMTGLKARAAATPARAAPRQRD